MNKETKLGDIVTYYGDYGIVLEVGHRLRKVFFFQLNFIELIDSNNMTLRVVS